MNSKTKNIILGSIITLLVVGGFIGFLVFQAKKPGQYDDLAQCVSNSGAKFYGAFWCPHCQAQKAAFGKSAKLLPYIECSESNGKTQTQACIDADIKGYPTWEFADGSRSSGRLSVEELAEITSCTL